MHSTDTMLRFRSISLQHPEFKQQTSDQVLALFLGGRFPGKGAGRKPRYQHMNEATLVPLCLQICKPHQTQVETTCLRPALHLLCRLRRTFAIMKTRMSKIFDPRQAEKRPVIKNTIRAHRIDHPHRQNIRLTLHTLPPYASP